MINKMLSFSLLLTVFALFTEVCVTRARLNEVALDQMGTLQQFDLQTPQGLLIDPDNNEGHEPYNGETFNPPPSDYIEKSPLVWNSEELLWQVHLTGYNRLTPT